MRLLLVACVAACLSACAGSPAAPTELSSGTTTNIAGTWNGNIVSSNNPSVQLKMVLTQSGSSVSGTWDSSDVSWAGQISGSVSGSSFTAQFTFSGTASDGTVCTGTASVAGSTTATTMSLTSTSGVVGGTCPAPLPTGLKIDVQRQ